MKRIVPAAALVLAVLLPATPAEAGQPILPTARMAVENLVEAYRGAWVDGRPRHVMKLLHDDAILIPHHGAEPLVGEDAIYDFWWPRGGTKFVITSYELTPTEIYGEDDLVYVIARFRIEYWMGEKEERKTIRNEGNWMAIVSRRDKGEPWKISRIMWNDPVEQVKASPAP